MSNRRLFLRSALGAAGGLLLPWRGGGAMALDLEAPRVPVTPVSLPVSPEVRQMREILGALHEIRLENRCSGGPGSEWAGLYREYRPLARRVVSRPVRSWSDCVELAEIAWNAWPCIDKYSGRLEPSHDGLMGTRQQSAAAALIEGVLTLGNGVRFDPNMVYGEEEEKASRGTFRRGQGWITDSARLDAILEQEEACHHCVPDTEKRARLVAEQAEQRKRG
jgi:hypothetical protein